MEHQAGNDFEPEFITLTNDAGEQVDFVELAGVEFADDSVYVVMQPVPTSDMYAEDEVYVFRVEENDEGAAYYAEEDSEIIDAVLAAYDRMLHTEEGEIPSDPAGE